jgi:uncharacterized paraquat-inducible protein A
MAKCPECMTQQKFLSVITLSNSRSILCPVCGVQLKANSSKNSAFGGVSAIALIGIYNVASAPYNWLVVAASIAVLLGLYSYWIKIEITNT